MGPHKQDSTEAYRAGEFSVLRERLYGDGYLFLHKVVDPKAVLAAHAVVEQNLSDRERREGCLLTGPRSRALGPGTASNPAHEAFRPLRLVPA